MYKSRVMLTIGHRSFTIAKSVLVTIEYVDDRQYLLKELADIALTKACEELALNKDEVHLFDYTVYNDIIIIDW